MLVALVAVLALNPSAKAEETIKMSISSHGEMRYKVTTTKVDYQHGDVKLQGVLATPDPILTNSKSPAILIIHEWWGLNDYAIMRASKLAEMGYVAFALDMYGEGKNSDKVDDAKAWSGEFYGKPLMAQRAQAGLDVLLKDPRVDQDNIIVIGYCFGGTAAVELAYSGAKIKGAVSFHGTPSIPSEAQAKNTVARLLVLTGAKDPMFDAAQRQALADGLDKTKIDWSMVVYGHAVHSFTNPGADKHNMPGVSYNKEADTRSWLALQSFMHQVFDHN